MYVHESRFICTPNMRGEHGLFFPSPKPILRQDMCIQLQDMSKMSALGLAWSCQLRMLRHERTWSTLGSVELERKNELWVHAPKTFMKSVWACPRSSWVTIRTRKLGRVASRYTGTKHRSLSAPPSVWRDTQEGHLDYRPHKL